MIRFLSKRIILTMHDDQLTRYGGKSGIRDSALSQPEASFGGEYVHEDIFHMAAAYGFHICQNHPFLDGNKRTSLIAMYTFLYVNGYRLIPDKRSLFAIMIDLASGKVSKGELRIFLKDNSVQKE